MTFAQSASSSSATIMGSEVITPWPISAMGAAMVTVLSVPIVTQPPMVLAASEATTPSGRAVMRPLKAKVKVSPAAPPRKSRRESAAASLGIKVVMAQASRAARWMARTMRG